ncbi:MAG: glutamate synthase subunit beta [Acidobacteria bacterium]|nr:glutamate synthase subunit beta [Acidobacteriota bacterium]
MGKTTGFMEFQRETFGRRPVAERVNDWFEVYQPLPEERVRTQGARCMDCGVPFCHTGCPLTNLIPDWNDLVYRNRWQAAIRELHATNNFPEFTSRVCPAPCESACVLGINEPPVAIKTIERSIIDHAWSEGWIRPEPPAESTGKRVAVIGSGPAGLAAAQQLARAGHLVTVFEKADRVGGLLRYGIPDFKMEKQHIDRRMEQLAAEGVTFRTSCHVGVDVSAADLRRDFHAVLLAGGAEQPRDLPIPGRQLKGIHFAMEFLPLNNRRAAGDSVPESQWISAAGRNVIIIGGGDTGADCLGTSHRHKAASIRQFEIMPRPPEQRAGSTPWPLWPLMLRSESSHEEGGERFWSILTTEFLGDSNGHVRALKTVDVGPAPTFEPIPGTEREFPADLILLAMGFTGPVKNGLLEQLAVELDPRGNVKAADNYMTSVDGVFAAGDMRRGQSLVVWAIAEGRKAAGNINLWLSR